MVYSPYPRRPERLTICRYNYKGSTFSSVILRATASKYRESADSKENSDFLLLRQKDPFGKLDAYLRSLGLYLWEKLWFCWT